MATTPTLLTVVEDIRTAVAGMTTPTYHYDIAASQVLDAPPIDEIIVATLPVVIIYCPAEQRDAFTLATRTITATVLMDILVPDGADEDATWQNAIKVQSDIMRVINSTTISSVFTAGTNVTSVEWVAYGHGNQEIGSALFHGRLSLAVTYIRPNEGGL